MRKLPISEVNDLPSIAVFQPIDPNSVRSRLVEQDRASLPTNGYNLDSLRQFSPLARMDSIDKLGVATHMLSDSVSQYSKSGLYSSLIKSVQTKKK